ncbi:hypothetical protein [Stygiobacter electus]|uniref:Uncharacterized protein n=1 Tax=Stygiobacter electus TaxID=3032292 RepID=A0AAE3NZL5_9BACT|nr:hypothetical protein [Stygiobacter electus]MDF1611639.1 hypothetical protein [Stygiobacter electus]
MGSQQILLIALGIILVALTIFAGYGIAKDYLENTNREQLISTIYDIGLLAQQYSKKDVKAGGGGGTFNGWIIPAQLRSTESGTFNAFVSQDKVNLTAVGKEIGMNGITNVRVNAIVDVNEIKIIVVN